MRCGATFVREIPILPPFEYYDLPAGYRAGGSAAPDTGLKDRLLALHEEHLKALRENAEQRAEIERLRQQLLTLTGELRRREIDAAGAASASETDAVGEVG